MPPSPPTHTERDTKFILPPWKSTGEETPAGLGLAFCLFCFCLNCYCCFFFVYFSHVCGATALAHASGPENSQFSPSTEWDQTQVFRLGGKCCVLLTWAISQTRREAGKRVGQLGGEDSKDSLSVLDCPMMTPV